MTTSDLFHRLCTINVMTGTKVAASWKVWLAKRFGSFDTNTVAGVRYEYYTWLGTTYCTDIRLA